jgi:GNAT superfamily N-acetyltransferase
MSVTLRMLRSDDPSVLQWVAEEGDAVVGFLYAYVERRRTRDPFQILLYEIEVEDGRRREGIGRALVAALETWMGERGIAEVWVLADNPGAEAFYAACGFVRSERQPVQYEKRLA